MSKKKRLIKQRLQESLEGQQAVKKNPLFERLGYHIILSFFVLFTYFNSIGNAFLSDDIFGIVENPHIGEWSNVTSSSFHFFQPLVYYILYHLGGLNPILFRLINIFAHLGSVNLIFLIVCTLLTPLAAFIAAALFAVHPLLSEPIVWISGGTFVWYSFFFFLSFYWYIKSIHRKVFYYFSLVAFWMSVTTGAPAVVLCGVFVLYEMSFGDIRKRWKYAVPYILLSGLFAFIAIKGIGSRLTSIETNFYQQETSYNPILQIPVAISSYIELFVWPAALTLYHSELHFDMWTYALKVMVMSGVFISIIIGYVKNKYVFFGLSLFVLSLLPTLTPIAVAWVVAERYVYFGTFGLIFITAYFLSKLSKVNEGILYGVLISLILVFSVRTIIRNVDWRNEDNLWIATGKTSPSDPKTHNNLGDTYARRGDLQKAAEEFGMAIQLNPQYADAYHNLGNIYRQMGETEKAEKLFRQALDINPNIWQSHQNLAAIYYERKDYQNAEKYSLEAIKLKQDLPQLYNNLGVVYMQSGQLEKAHASFQKSLSLNPHDEFAQKALVELQKK